MKRAFVLTAYDRPNYFRQAVDSLSGVRGWEDWHVVFSVEPSPQQDEVLEIIYEGVGPIAECTTVEVLINPERYGVLHHPWVVFDRLFMDQGFDYVVRSEDDLIHSQDILEYQKWASTAYEHDPAVGIVTSFSSDGRSHAEVHRRIGLGSPLVIGTWKSTWSEVYRDTWDHDYSTGQNGVMAGWDHNLNLRVMPPRGLHAILPNHTKVFHLGVWGTHSTPEVYQQMPAFDPVVPPQEYREVPE